MGQLIPDDGRKNETGGDGKPLKPPPAYTKQLMKTGENNSNCMYRENQINWQ